MGKPKKLLLHLLSILFFTMLSAMPGDIYAATGVVTITHPNQPITVPPNSTFTIQGTYLLSSDTTPTGAIDPASGLCKAWGVNHPGNYVPSYRPSLKWYRIHGNVHYDVDGVRRGTITQLQTDVWGNTSIGGTAAYTIQVNTANMLPGTSHTATIYMEDTYAASCYTRGSEKPVIGNVFASATIHFTIINPSPEVSVTLDKASLYSCEAETGTVTVTSNDPIPNGGTVTLTFPNKTTVSAPFAGKTAAFTFADFGFPNGYRGVHKPGDILNFTAHVSTADGYTASFTASANVIADGLNVTVIPAKQEIYPFLNNSRKSYFPGKYSTPVDIEVTCNNTPVVGAQVSTQVRMLAGSETFGGHDHGAVDGASKPTGWMLTASGQTDTNGLFSTTYHASEFSGQDKITATATYHGLTATSLPVVITSKIPGLIPITLPAGGPHQFVGGRCEHYGAPTPWNTNKTAACGGVTGTSNQYISRGIATTFYNFLNEYQQLYGAGLYINDASLKFGGMFDVNGGWHTGSNHSTHRIGVDVDFALKDTSAPVTGLPIHFPVVWDNILGSRLADLSV